MWTRIIIDDPEPSPWPSDDRAWDGVLVVTGGLDSPTQADVLAHWGRQGVPIDDAHELLRRAESNVVIKVVNLFGLGECECARRYALTDRAVQDAAAKAYPRPLGGRE